MLWLQIKFDLINFIELQLHGQSAIECRPGAQPRLGDQGLGPNTKGRAGCWVREGVAPSRFEGPGVSSPENF